MVSEHQSVSFLHLLLVAVVLDVSAGHLKFSSAIFVLLFDVSISVQKLLPEAIINHIYGDLYSLSLASSFPCYGR